MVKNRYDEGRAIRVLMVRPNRRPEVVILEGSLSSMQNAVGGCIECVYPFSDDAVLVCNEESKYNGASLNRAIWTDSGAIADIIAGDFFICRAPEDSERFESLTDR